MFFPSIRKPRTIPQMSRLARTLEYISIVGANGTMFSMIIHRNGNFEIEVIDNAEKNNA